MEWHKSDPWSELSDCRRYSVCRVVCSGVGHFEAWHAKLDVYRKPIVGKSQMLGMFKTQHEARACCEDHKESSQSGLPASPPARAPQLGLL